LMKIFSILIPFSQRNLFFLKEKSSPSTQKDSRHRKTSQHQATLKDDQQ
jgi:hypothetical protein